jgi:hypothetical protein
MEPMVGEHGIRMGPANADATGAAFAAEVPGHSGKPDSAKHSSLRGETGSKRYS